VPDQASIRKARATDAETLAGFNRAMARETESKELERDASLRGVRALLEHPEHGRYLVAEVGGDAAGSLMLTTEWSDWRNGFFWWIQSVYVQPERRRQGVYRALHEEVRRQARREGDVCGIRLYVERENGGARQVYESLGMESTGYRLYEEPL